MIPSSFCAALPCSYDSYGFRLRFCVRGTRVLCGSLLDDEDDAQDSGVTLHSRWSHVTGGESLDVGDDSDPDQGRKSLVLQQLWSLFDVNFICQS